MNANGGWRLKTFQKQSILLFLEGVPAGEVGTRRIWADDEAATVSIRARDHGLSGTRLSGPDGSGARPGRLAALLATARSHSSANTAWAAERSPIRAPNVATTNWAGDTRSLLRG